VEEEGSSMACSVRHGSSETGTLKKSKVNSASMEDRHEIRCSKCHKAGHNRQRCEENVRTWDMKPVINLVSILSFLLYLKVCIVYLFISLCIMRCLFMYCIMSHALTHCFKTWQGGALILTARGGV
jgi:hypothetical protein